MASFKIMLHIYNRYEHLKSKLTNRLGRHSFGASDIKWRREEEFLRRAYWATFIIERYSIHVKLLTYSELKIPFIFPGTHLDTFSDYIELPFGSIDPFVQESKHLNTSFHFLSYIKLRQTLNRAKEVVGIFTLCRHLTVSRPDCS
jgi:hypothetical protein